MSREPLRVLYVEDDPVDADLLKRELERQAPVIGMEIVSTLAAARLKLEGDSPPYDVVLVDLKLPDGNGLELVTAIRKLELPVAVIVLTGTGDQAAAVAVLKAGADDYIVKESRHLLRLPGLIEGALLRSSAARQRRQQPLRVLYAEPSAFDVDLTIRYLAQNARHIKMESVPRGEDVLERLAGSDMPSAYDVLLLDYRLPGVNALELVKVLRQELGVSIPIVLVTGHGTDEVAVQAIRLGVDDYLVKREGYLNRLPIVLENVQVRAQLKEVEARFRNLFSSLRDVVIVADNDRNILDANQPALRLLFGYEIAEVCGKSTEMLYAKRQEFESVGRVVSKLRVSGDGVLQEVTLRRKSGEEFIGELFFTRLQNSRGEEEGAIALIRDVTARRRAEEIQQNLLQTRADILECAVNRPLADLLKTALDRVSELVGSPIRFYCFVDEDNQKLDFQLWSSGVLEEACESGQTNLQGPIDEAGVWADCVRNKQAVIRNNYPTTLERNGKPDGQGEVIRELIVPVIRDNKVLAVMGFGNKPEEYSKEDLQIVQYLADVTWDSIETVRSKEALTKSELERGRLQAAIEQIDEAVVITDRDGIIQYVNPCFERSSGYSEMEVLGRTPGVLKSGKQEPSVYRELWQTISGGKTWSGRLINQRKDGSLYTEQATISPVVGPGGEIQHFVAVKRDITEHLALASRLEQAQKLEAIGTLAGGIAHDFNNILSSILGYTELIASELGEPDRVKEDLDQVMIAGKRAAGLVRQILTIARQSEQGRRPVGIQLIVREAIQLLRPTISSNIRIETDLDSETPKVLADPGAIHQVVMNLCVNASQSMLAVKGRDHLLRIGVGSVVLDAQTAAQLALSGPGHFAKLTVSDTGCGMDEEVLTRIFDPYFTTKGKARGTGLGLAMVHSIVQGGGGAIVVESVPLQGSSFTVYLPVYDGDPAAFEGIADIGDPRGGTERILVLDDEESIAGVLSRTLLSNGYQVSTYTDSREALRDFTAAPFDFDCIVTDLNMPGMLGTDFARACVESRAGVPIILCTGYSEESGIDGDSVSGITKLLLKPVEARQLLVQVRQVLDEHMKNE